MVGLYGLTRVKFISDWINTCHRPGSLSYVFVNKKVLQKGVKKVSTFNTQ